MWQIERNELPIDGPGAFYYFIGVAEETNGASNGGGGGKVKRKKGSKEARKRNGRHTEGWKIPCTSSIVWRGFGFV